MTNVTGTEVQARREALGLSQSGLANYLGVAQPTVSSWESGKRTIPTGVDAELTQLEQRVEALVERMVETILDMDDVRIGFLITHTVDQSFWEQHPEHEGLPATLHRVAAARARAEIAEEGYELRITSESD